MWGFQLDKEILVALGASTVGEVGGLIYALIVSTKITKDIGFEEEINTIKAMLSR